MTYSLTSVNASSSKFHFGNLRIMPPGSGKNFDGGDLDSLTLRNMANAANNIAKDTSRSKSIRIDASNAADRFNGLAAIRPDASIENSNPSWQEPQ